MKKNKSKKMLQIRNRIVEMLNAFGFKESKENLQDDRFWERDWKKVNSGESRYRLETWVTKVGCLWQKLARGVWDVKKMDEMRVNFFMWLRYGIEFSYERDDRTMYGLINLVDWSNLSSNAFGYEVGVPAYRCGREEVETDGFVWDIVLTVNSMPLVGIVIDDREDKNGGALDKLQAELCRDSFMSTYLQLCMVYDGESVLVGTVSDDIHDYKGWVSLIGEDPDNVDVDVMLPFMSLLRPDRLMDVLQNFMRVLKDRNGGKWLWLADCEKYFAVKDVVEKIKRHFAVSDEPMVGHVLIENNPAHEMIGLGNDVKVTMDLLADYLDLHDVLPEGMDVVIGRRVNDDIVIDDDVEYEGKNIMLLCGPGLSTADCDDVLGMFKNVSLIQFAYSPYPFMTYGGEFCGDMIYCQKRWRVER